MGGDRKRRGNPKRHGCDDRCRDDGAVDEGVERVADDDERRRAARVNFALVGIVAVPPHDEFLEQEKREYAGKQRPKRMPRGDTLERFREQCQQRHSEQRADGVADQPRHELDAQMIAKQKERRRCQESAKAAEDTQPYRGRIDLRMMHRAMILHSSASADEPGRHGTAT